MRGRTCSLAVLLIVAVTVTLSSPATANNVVLGSDYLTTQPGTFFDFGGPVGVVNLEGRPIGPGSTDTIVQRKEDALLPAVGSSDTIPIELVALSLQSVNPVNIGGSFFDVFVDLNPAAQSTGTMTIRHEFADGTPGGEGTFDSTMHVFFVASFVPVGGGAPVIVPDQIQLFSNGTAWSHLPPPGTLLVTAPPASAQDANRHLGRVIQDFFPVSVTQRDEQGRGSYIGTPTQVPLPATAVLLAAGLLLGAFARRTRG